MTTTIESATIYTPGDVESIDCVCGNNTGEDGFFQCDEQGVPASLKTIRPVPAGMSELVPGNNNFFACHDCGRVYSDATIIEQNTAPVIKRLPEAELHAAQDLYWRENEF